MAEYKCTEVKMDMGKCMGQPAQGAANSLCSLDAQGKECRYF
jgi:hypothetical protein